MDGDDNGSVLGRRGHHPSTTAPRLPPAGGKREDFEKCDKVKAPEVLKDRAESEEGSLRWGWGRQPCIVLLLRERIVSCCWRWGSLLKNISSQLVIPLEFKKKEKKILLVMFFIFVSICNEPASVKS